MSAFDVPIIRATAFTERVLLDGELYQLDLRWNSRTATWALDVAKDGEVIIAGVTLRVGTPLLRRFGRKPGLPPGEIMALDTSGQDLDPAYDELGDRVKLLYLDAEGLAEALA